MKKVLNVLVAIILIALSIYVITYIPKAVDFSRVVVRLQDNDTIYPFLIYLPIIISIFNAVLTLYNLDADNIVLTFMNVFISLGIVIYLIVDVMQSVFAIKEIGNKLMYLKYGNIAAIILLIGEIIYHFIVIKKKKEVKA